MEHVLPHGVILQTKGDTDALFTEVSVGEVEQPQGAGGLLAGGPGLGGGAGSVNRSAIIKVIQAVCCFAPS